MYCSLPNRIELIVRKSQLPEAFASREADEGEAYLSKDDLVKVVQWKLWIGANRPSLLAYAKSTDGKQVCAMFGGLLGSADFRCDV